MADFKIVNGVCRPQTFEALDLYKGIQNEANRSLSAQGADLLFVDGRIGEKTRKAVNKVLGASFQDCAQIANSAQKVLTQLTSLANSRNLVIVAPPESIVRSVVSPPSKFDEETGQVVHPSLATAGFMGVPLWAIALFGAGGYYYFKKTKSGKKQWKSLTGGF
jgi:hypothetical protein